MRSTAEGIQHVTRDEGDDRFEILQVQSELDQMIDLYQTAKPKRVLEIGSWYGGTLKEWLTKGDPEFVIAVDLEHPNLDGYYEWVGRDTTLAPIVGNSWDPAIVNAVLRNGPYDWVFIDGDHGDYGVRTDIGNYLPMVNKGGHLLMHDIQPPVGDPSWPHDWYPPGVVLRELAADYVTDSFVDPKPEPWAHGVGVVYV